MRGGAILRQEAAYGTKCHTGEVLWIQCSHYLFFIFALWYVKLSVVYLRKERFKLVVLWWLKSGFTLCGVYNKGSQNRIRQLKFWKCFEGSEVESTVPVIAKRLKNDYKE